MQTRASILLVPCLIAITVSAALAQQPPVVQRSPAEDPRGYIAALAGRFSQPPTRTMFSVEGAENMRRDLQGYASVSYYDNLMTAELQNTLTSVASALSDVLGTPFNFSGRDRGIAFLAGVKYVAPTGVVSPYVAGGLGVLNLRRTVLDPRFGDMSAEVFNDFDIGDRGLIDRSVTNPLTEAAVGVAITAGHAYIDVGFRYRKAFRFPEPLDFSQFNIGLGYAF